jgi:gas vesicle protein
MGNERGDAAGYLGWFLFGSAIGAVAAILMTPKTGQEARDLLSEKGNEWARRAQDAAAEAQGRAGQWIDKSRELFEEQTTRLMSAFDAGKEAMREEARKGPHDPRA